MVKETQIEAHKFSSLFSNSLRESLQNKSMANPIISRLEWIKEHRYDYNFLVNKSLEVENIRDHKNKRERTLQRLFEYKDENGRVIKTLYYTFAGEIAEYLAVFSTSDVKDLIAEIKSVNLYSLTFLYNKHSDYMDIIPKIDEIYRNEEFSNYPRYYTPLIFSTLFHYAYIKLGITKALKLINDFIRLQSENAFLHDSRIPIEVFMNATDYCVDNSEYPFEWLIDNAFNSENKVIDKVIDKVKEGAL